LIIEQQTRKKSVAANILTIIFELWQTYECSVSGVVPFNVSVKIFMLFYKIFLVTGYPDGFSRVYMKMVLYHLVKDV
jgi:hypothetical protein